MADHISFRMVTEPTRNGLRGIQRSTDVATRAGLRAVGRKVAVEARKRAPVYKGPPKTVNYGDGNRGPLVPGELRRGIRPSKRLKMHGPADYSMAVGPRGGHVHLYATKQDAATPFMKPAYDVASSEARMIHAKAWEKAMRR